MSFYLTRLAVILVAFSLLAPALIAQSADQKANAITKFERNIQTSIAKKPQSVELRERYVYFLWKEKRYKEALAQVDEALQIKAQNTDRLASARPILAKLTQAKNEQQRTPLDKHFKDLWGK